MSHKYLIPTIFGFCYILLLQPGFQQNTIASAAPETTPQTTTPTAEPSKVQNLPADKKGPQITFEKLVYDFGNVGANTQNTCEFNFKNTGDDLLKITEVSRTCGCTVYSLEKKEYAPRESGILKVSYNAGSRPDSIEKHLYVSSNDKANPKIQLTIKADITLKVDYEPRTLNLLLKGENAACPQITIKSLDNQPFAIKDFKSTDDLITTDYNNAEEKMNFVIQPKVDPAKLRKTNNGRIDIALTHPAVNEITIPFTVLQKFDISPARINILKAEPAKPLTREIWVLSNYDEDFDIESVSTQNNLIKVLTQEKIGNRYKLELQITPPPPEANQKMFKDTFFVNIKGGQKLQLPCTGFYLKTPQQPQSQ
jgi:hypothetical protein